MNSIQITWLVLGLVLSFLLGGCLVITLIARSLKESFVDILQIALEGFKNKAKTDDQE